MRQFNALVFTLILLTCATLALRELDFRDRQAKTPRPITVYVCGEVTAGGVVSLPSDARRIHAVELCGGLTADADTSAFAPAEHLVDGETIEVPRKVSVEERPVLEKARELPDSVRSATDAEPPSNAPRSEVRPIRIDINRATPSELELLPGIGPVMAQRIVETRQSLPGGTFRSLEDLTAIRGIKGKTLARLKPYLEPEGL